MNRVAILGPGLLGGSIAMALRARAEPHVAIWGRRSDAIEQVHTAGLANFASTDLAAVARDADLVILCTPVGSMPALARELAPVIRADTIVTDVGSVKAVVAAELGEILREHGRFVGSHPMAGSEQSGLTAARADLFQGSVCIVTPDERTDAAALANVTTFWQTLGCSVRQLPPDQHDEIAALMSHFPHLLAASLVTEVREQNAQAFEFCGPGFRDMTRVASGPPAMWAEILCANRDAVQKCAEAMIEKLREITTLLGHESREQAMHDFLTHAKASRDRLRRSK